MDRPVYVAVALVLAGLLALDGRRPSWVVLLGALASAALPMVLLRDMPAELEP